MGPHPRSRNPPPRAEKVSTAELPTGFGADQEAKSSALRRISDEHGSDRMQIGNGLVCHRPNFGVCLRIDLPVGRAYTIESNL